MKNIIISVITSIILITGIVLGAMSGVVVSALQFETLKILAIICGISMVYCFIVGEITRNNSQMDKLWSITPIIYAWVIVAMGQFNIRLIVMAVLITLWGARLTANFARKGAYSLKFWTGEEDYRWPLLRNSKYFNKFTWAIFDLIFISFYQNALVLAICFPMVAVMESTAAFNWVDIVAAALMFGFIAYETIADEQQMKFQTTKHKMLKEGKTLEELPAPYNLGFNTTGLWNYSRHPNYFAEQSIWVCLYIFVLGSGIALKFGVFHWTIIGCLVLIMLFMGSSMLGEAISSKKYPLYKDYQKSVEKYLPIRRYRK